MKSEKADRLIRIMRLIQSGGAIEPNRLARELSVSRRTVFRDLKILNGAGVNYEFDRASRSYSGRSSTMPAPLSLTTCEALALILLFRCIPGGVPFIPDPEAAQDACVKVEGSLSPELLATCAPFLQQVEVRCTPYHRETRLKEWFSLFQRSIAARLKTQLHYGFEDASKPWHGVICAQRLALINQIWYVLAQVEKEEGRLKFFQMSRIQSAEILAENYVLEPQLSLEELLGDAWSVEALEGESDTHNVRILFSGDPALRAAEWVWHPTQRCTFLPDGRMLFEARVRGLNEFCRWILGFGAGAQVVSPPRLRDMMRNEIERLQSIYQTAS